MCVVLVQCFVVMPRGHASFQGTQLSLSSKIKVYTMNGVCTRLVVFEVFMSFMLKIIAMHFVLTRQTCSSEVKAIPPLPTSLTDMDILCAFSYSL